VPLPGLPPIHHSIVRLRELLERFTAVLLGFLASATFVLCRLQKKCNGVIYRCFLKEFSDNRLLNEELLKTR